MHTKRIKFSDMSGTEFQTKDEARISSNVPDDGTCRGNWKCGSHVNFEQKSVTN